MTGRPRFVDSVVQKYSYHNGYNLGDTWQAWVISAQGSWATLSPFGVFEEHFSFWGTKGGGSVSRQGSAMGGMARQEHCLLLGITNSACPSVNITKSVKKFALNKLDRCFLND